MGARETGLSASIIRCPVRNAQGVPATDQNRAGGIRTHGLHVPNVALYQAEPQPVNFGWEHGDYISVRGKSTGEIKSEVRSKKAEVVDRGKFNPVVRMLPSKGVAFGSLDHFCLLTSYF